MIRTFIVSCIALIAIFKQTGEGASIGNCYAGIYGHNTMIADGVPAVSISIVLAGFTGTFFCATGIGAAVDGNSTIVIHCGSTMRIIIYSAGSLNRQGTAQSYRNSVHVRFVGQGLTIQVQGNSFVFRNSDACSYIITQRYFATVSNGSLQRIWGRHYICTLRHRHDGQHYSHHKQGQRYAYYFFHVNLSFLVFVFCFLPAGRGSCLCANTRKPHGASDTPILAPFCPQYQYHCAFFCINFPLIFVHYSIFGTHPAKKNAPES